MRKGLAILIFLALALPLSVLAIQIAITNPLTAKDFRELIENIITFIYNIALVLVPLMIVIAGFYFVTAAGDPEQIKRAKNIIFYTLIGFITILLAKGVIAFLKQVL
jgi:fumarate reductase subunit D